jgi:hypothetical protein
MPDVLAFVGDNLPWILLTLALIGWLMTWLIMKWSARLVFGTIWWGIKQLAYWLIWYGFWATLKWLGRLFVRGVKASGRGAKAMGSKGKNAFKHHPWWGVGLLIVGLIFLQAVIPYNYPGRQDVDVLLPWLLGFYFFVMAFVRFIMYALRRA